jgi:excisionase family DNA binding protein
MVPSGQRSDRLLISQREACERFDVSRLTLIREIQTGRLRYLLVGKRRKFTLEESKAYVERQVREWDGGIGPRGRLSGFAPTRSMAIDFGSALALTTGKPPRSTRRNFSRD